MWRSTTHLCTCWLLFITKSLFLECLFFPRKYSRMIRKNHWREIRGTCWGKLFVSNPSFDTKAVAQFDHAIHVKLFKYSKNSRNFSFAPFWNVQQCLETQIGEEEYKKKYWIIENKARWRASFRKASLWTEHTFDREPREKPIFCIRRKHFSIEGMTHLKIRFFFKHSHMHLTYIYTHKIDFKCVKWIGQGMRLIFGILHNIIISRCECWAQIKWVRAVNWRRKSRTADLTPRHSRLARAGAAIIKFEA